MADNTLGSGVYNTGILTSDMDERSVGAQEKHYKKSMIDLHLRYKRPDKVHVSLLSKLEQNQDPAYRPGSHARLLVHAALLMSTLYNPPALTLVNDALLPPARRLVWRVHELQMSRRC